MRPGPLLSHLLTLGAAAGTFAGKTTAGEPAKPSTAGSADTGLPAANKVNDGRGAFFRSLVDTGPADLSRLPFKYNSRPGGRAAKRFNRQFQNDVLAAPGSVHASRSDLGLRPDNFVMTDLGGEGEKTTGNGFKFGSSHAININANTEISSTPIDVSFELGGPSVHVVHGYIPNLIRPSEEWLAPDADVEKPLPLSDDFSNLTIMENAPLNAKNVEEIARITDKNGWIFLALSDYFEENVQKLADTHNGGNLVTFPGEYGFSRYVIPPAIRAGDPSLGPIFQDVNGHNVFAIVRNLQSTDGTVATEAKRQVAAGLDVLRQALQAAPQAALGELTRRFKLVSRFVENQQSDGSSTSGEGGSLFNPTSAEMLSILTTAALAVFIGQRALARKRSTPPDAPPLDLIKLLELQKDMLEPGIHSTPNDAGSIPSISGVLERNRLLQLEKAVLDLGIRSNSDRARPMANIWEAFGS
ncbi:MAG: hypothetical protein JWM42_3194 [Burkholderia sp.]|nr:hypothetical protein [Burkholderia sp.]